jgi:hypothetical protein
MSSSQNIFVLFIFALVCITINSYNVKQAQYLSNSNSSSDNKQQIWSAEIDSDSSSDNNYDSSSDNNYDSSSDSNNDSDNDSSSDIELDIESPIKKKYKFNGEFNEKTLEGTSTNILPSFNSMKGVENFDSLSAPVSRSLEYNEPVYDTFNAPQTDQYAGEDFYEHGNATLLAEGYKDCPPETMRVFFSEDNMKRIQKKLRREIHKRSYGKFKLKVDQDVKKLLIAMRAVMILHAKFLPKKIIRQVKRLNEETVQYIAPYMIVNLKQQYSYIQDITNPIQPLPDPINVNQTGRNQLRSVTALWNI